jgi:hypothetical protein
MSGFSDVGTYQKSPLDWWREGQKEKTQCLEYPDGTRKWYCEGQLHRIGGPAVAGPNGLEWWIHGERMMVRPADGDRKVRRDLGKRHRVSLEVRLEKSRKMKEYWAGIRAGTKKAREIKRKLN